MSNIGKDDDGDSEVPNSKCDCARCKELGPPDRLILGFDHAIAFRSDGSADGGSSRGSTNRRTPIRFNRSRDGGLVPAERGRRRKAVIEELGPILSAHGVALSDEEQRGLISYISPEELVVRIDALRKDGASASDAIRQVAEENQMTVKYIQDRYYKCRKDVYLVPSIPPEYRGRIDLEGPPLTLLIETVARKLGIKYNEASQRISKYFGWDAQEFIHRTVGTWQWVPCDHSGSGLTGRYVNLDRVSPSD